MSNRLAEEKSPYLRQHAENPVDWYPWGTAALQRARAEDKPIVVSIGYSACHWCHVMAHESFEDEDVARFMNDRFVNIKVDREERPDVDAIYMEAVQALSGHGGWPLNVFLTPDGRPFFGGTYFPPAPRHGLPSWLQVLQSIDAVYRERRDELLHNADILTQAIEQGQRLGEAEVGIQPDTIDRAVDSMMAQADCQRGGFGGAPKFPQPLALEFLLRTSRRNRDGRILDFIMLTLDRMADGGIFDHLGGGFHRYSVDATWTVPHFEKMLYDNALLARMYLYAYQVTGNERYRGVVEATLDYLLREMRAPRGGFYAAEDADSEGVEGKYYVWTPEALRQVLQPEEAKLAEVAYGVTPQGNFEGETILTRRADDDTLAALTGLPLSQIPGSLQAVRENLLAVRSKRVPPGKDTKILASWNALAIRAFAEAGRALDRPDYLEAASAAASFIWEHMVDKGNLLRSYLEGAGETRAFLEDYAFLTEALLSLSEALLDPRYLHAATDLADEMLARFWDERRRVFFDTQTGEDALVVRPRSLYDNPIPSGNSSAVNALLRLAALTGDARYGERADIVLRGLGEPMARAPLGFPYMICAFDFSLDPPIQIGLVGKSAGEMRTLAQEVFGRYLPNAVMSAGPAGSTPLLEGREPIDGRPTAYVCEHFSCQLPATSVEVLRTQLDRAEVRSGG